MNSRAATINDVSVNFGGFDITVTELLLDCVDICATFEEMGSNPMPLS